MRFIFLDDSQQSAPSRKGMSGLVGIGGIGIAADKIHGLERQLRSLCEKAGFSPLEPFKWSPGKELWMRKNLVSEARRDFFIEGLRFARDAGATAMVAISDKSCRPATKTAKTTEEDVTNLALERIQHYLSRQGTHGLVITDRPSGARYDEGHFLMRCLDTLQKGAGYVVPDRVCINVVSSPSKYIRLLQLADIVVSCSLAYIGGEYTHSPAVFEGSIRPLLYSDGNRIGGLGLKLHPEFRYVNLHHWLLKDTHHWRFNVGYPLPMKDFPYAKSPDQP